MYNRIKDNNLLIHELFELNNMIQTCDFDQILSYLDLDYTISDLTPSSYQKLKDNYKRYIKQSR